MSDVIIRQARAADLPALVHMLADDVLGRQREDASEPLAASYSEAFAAIDGSPTEELLVACLDDDAVGMLQVSYTPSLSFRGGWRATIEGVRTLTSHRGRGIGRRLVLDAVERARTRGCRMVQLTTNRERPDAHRFYERLGFEPTHVGMKLMLETGVPAGGGAR